MPFDMITADDDLLLTSGDLNFGNDQDQGAQANANQAAENKDEEADEGDEDDLEQSRVGTPYYLSPEIWRSKRYSKESDIWALGVILYELCCLQYPFPATEMEELE